MGKSQSKECGSCTTMANRRCSAKPNPNRLLVQLGNIEVVGVQVIQRVAGVHFGVKAQLSNGGVVTLDKNVDITRVCVWRKESAKAWKQFSEVMQPTRDTTLLDLYKASEAKKEYNLLTNNCISAMKRMMRRAVPGLFGRAAMLSQSLAYYSAAIRSTVPWLFKTKLSLLSKE